MGDSRYIYQNELDKACFQRNIAYGDFEYLHRRTASDKAFNIAKNPEYDGYQRGLASMVYKFFDQKYRLQINLLPVAVLKVKLCQASN